MTRKPPAEGAAPADPPVTPQDPPPAADAARELDEFTLGDDNVLAIGPDFKRDAAQLVDRLAVVGIVAPEAWIADLSDEDFQNASLYAVAAFAAADGLEFVVPERPAFLPEPWTATPAPELEPETPPIPTAARVSREQVEFLGTLSVNRYGLYRFPNLGFATEQRGPFYPEEFVKAQVDDGFAYFEPTGGAHGSVKITDAGRAAYRALRQTEPLPQAV